MISLCQWCLEHTARKVWYLNPDNHSVGTLNRFHRFWDWHIDMGILYGTIDNIAEKTKPWGFPKKQFMDFYAKRIHGGQVTTSLDEALNVLDMSEDVYLSYCTCRHSTHEDHPKLFKCLLLNNDAEQARRFDAKAKLKGKPTIGEFIDPEDAREIVIESRQDRNCFQTVLWKWPPRVACLCNCDQYCATWWAQEIKWGQLPSIKRSKVVNPDACDQCGVCIDVCHKKSITLGENGPQIAKESCLGCGLCVENCSNDVLSLEPRELIFDRQHGKKVNLMEQTSP